MFTQMHYHEQMKALNQKLKFEKVKRNDSYNSLFFRYNSNITLEIKMFKSGNVVYELAVIWDSMLADTISAKTHVELITQIPQIIMWGKILAKDYPNQNSNIILRILELETFLGEILKGTKND